MNYEYNIEPVPNVDIVDPGAVAVSVIGGIYILILLGMLLLCVGFYILKAYSLYTIARRREIKKSWMAWIPVANLWTLGSISDQYQYVVKGKVKNKRKILVGIAVATTMIPLAEVILGLGFFLSAGVAIGGGGFFGLIQSLGGAILLGLLSTAVMVALMVVEYLALYDVFYSCDPSDGVVYLILSIVVPFVLPILLFIIRKKDLGMPPRKVSQIAPPQDEAFYSDSVE